MTHRNVVLILSLLLGGSAWSNPITPTALSQCELSVPEEADCFSPSVLSGDLDCRYDVKSSYDPKDCGGNLAKCGSWGPHPIQYPPPAFSGTSCGSADWKHQRLMATVDYMVGKQVNYCHHHDPRWESPAPKLDSKPSSICTLRRNSKGQQASPGKSFSEEQVRWQGADGSNFTSFLYNFSLGFPRMTGQIGQQACDKIPGSVLLDVNGTNFDTMKQYLLPGDLLYIMEAPSEDNQSSPRPISHVVVWTGKTLAQLNKAAPDTFKGGDFDMYGEYTDDTPLIVDSHYAGPAYRPFIGWYQKSLSHARRIIGGDNLPAVKRLRLGNPPPACRVKKQASGSLPEHSVAGHVR